MNVIEKTDLENNHIVLRPLSEADYRVLFQWRSELESLYLWSHPRRLICYTEYVNTIEKSLRSEIDVWLLIVKKSSGEPLGFVYSYDTKIFDGHTFLTLFIAKPYRGKRVSFEAGILFVRYLMDYFPFQKIYADIFEFNAASKNFTQHCGFIQEGLFPKHRYHQGKYWGMCRYALYREKWEEVRQSKIAKNIFLQR